MKLLTLNTHSLQEEHYERKLEACAAVILQEQPDVIAMQEVNQSIDAPLARAALLDGYVPCLSGHAAIREDNHSTRIAIREDNHAARIARRLRDGGLSYSWTWMPAKVGYGKYDEGMALFSLKEGIRSAESFYISGCTDYQNWKTRRTLGIRTEGRADWFFTVHMGWWQDEQEPFAGQWKRLNNALQQKKEEGARIWLMGDFNSPAQFRGQGYDLIQADGWLDTYQLAEERDDGITVRGCIDGWRSFTENGQMPEGMRMDHIWCNSAAPIARSQVIFNGSNGPVVSDHFGVLITAADPDSRHY